MHNDWLTCPACDLGRGIGAGEIDPVELTEAFLDAIKSGPDSSMIYTHVTVGRARSEAREAAERAKRGERKSLLDGVPVSWKDLYDIEGIPTEAGSALLKGNVAEQDASAVETASSCGMVCLGKTHMTELAFSGLGVNPVTETPPNVNNADWVPGGSSSGAAASVAFGLAAAGIGSDTGGSVRVPAAWNDLVGFKPTKGMIPTDGMQPLCRRFDTIGPLTRTVEDAEALYALLSGAEDHCEPTLEREASQMSFLILENVAMEDLRPEPAAGFERAVRRLEMAGAAFEAANVSAASEASDMSGSIYSVEAYAMWGDLIEQNPSLMFGEILRRFRSGASTSGVNYVRSTYRLEELRQEYLHAVSEFDVVAIPTSPILPPERERLLADGDFFAKENLLALRNTRIGNLMEVPSITLPTGTPSTGLLLLGKPYEDDLLLSTARTVERILA